ncbi:FAD-dependent monooxygenase [Nonomuraea salmonea]|uniref:FAD-dependent monooxygenase n=1 Tax=Nonomuraea salmonea TaxID=46181 RepID=UPI002FED2B69
MVGADGLRSTVREACFGATVRPRYAGIVAWRGVARFNPPSYGETWGAGQVFGITPQEPGATNWYAAVATPEGHRETLDELRARFAGWHDPITRLLAEADEEAVLRHEIYDLSPRLKSLIAGNVALVGDAAHAMTPSLGQGACQALLDAAALTMCLESAGDVGSALRAYDARRRRPAQRVVAMSRQMTRLAGHHREGPPQHPHAPAARLTRLHRWPGEGGEQYGDVRREQDDRRGRGGPGRWWCGGFLPGHMCAVEDGGVPCTGRRRPPCDIRHVSHAETAPSTSRVRGG